MANKTKQRQKIKKQQQENAKLHEGAFEIPELFKINQSITIRENRKRRYEKYGDLNDYDFTRPVGKDKQNNN